MKKFVLKLDLEDEVEKRRAMKTVSSLSGIDEITIDMKGKKLMIIGTVDPVTVVSKLRKKNWATDILYVGPPKDPPKKEEPKKEEAKEEKKDEAKKEEEKKEEAKKREQELVVGMAMPYRQYYPAMAMPYRQYYPATNTYYHAHHSIEENPNACLIC